MRSPIALALVLLPTVASAHIHLTFPKSRTDSLTGDQKTEHCGVAGYVRADHPDRNNIFAPGATITVTWMETIPHPGWFRISFQPNGEVFRIPPESNGPDGDGDTANFPTEDFTGQTDPANSSIVLADRIADGTLSAQITLPNMECANCTLQFIQVMIDKPLYTITASSDDIYFNCADITLSASAPDAGVPGDGSGPGQEAGVNPGTGDPGGGCCSTGSSGGSSAVLGLLVLGLVIKRRR